MKNLLDTLRVLYALVITLAVGAEHPGGGADKKKAVIDQALAILDEPGGIEAPGWLRPYLPALLGIIVDVAVGVLNKTGFFGNSGG